MKIIFLQTMTIEQMAIQRALLDIPMRNTKELKLQIWTMLMLIDLSGGVRLR
jgi:hypothetical protein